MKSNWKRYTSLDEFITAEANAKNIMKVNNTLEHILRNKICSDDGLWLEFGVCSGATINLISSFTDNVVYGFDSFYGFPEPWTWASDDLSQASYGNFNREGKLPDVSGNVKLIAGWFNDTLPKFIEERKDSLKITFIHIDCDLYSSTKTILTELLPYIDSGTVICFDDLLGYPNYRQHEIKAFYEFLQETNHDFEWLCGETDEIARGRETSVAVRIL